MPEPIIALLTDFGADDVYAGVMKGVILGICPHARIEDICHETPRYDIGEAAYRLAAYAPWFPPGAIHVAVVDPGVGGGRRPIIIEAAGQTLICPDNGIATLWMSRLEEKPRIHELANAQFQLPNVSATFHGRDIFAPAAAHRALGVPIEEFGPPVHDPVLLPNLEVTQVKNGWRGRIIHVDHFGNLVANIHRSQIEKIEASKLVVKVKSCWLRGLKKTFSDGERGELVSYIGSAGWLEIAEVKGNCAYTLSASIGESVVAKELSPS